VVLARRRRGIDAPDEPLSPTAPLELTAADLVRMPRAGSQAESIGLGQEEKEEQGGW
jgi:hypothetical protein